MEFNSAIFRGKVEADWIDAGIFTVGLNDSTVRMGGFQRAGGTERIGFEYTGATGWYINLSALGGVWINGSQLALGTRTTAGTTWNNGTGLTGSGDGDAGWHKHQTDGHTHQVTI